MICKPCRAAADENDPFSHKICRGKTHCDCQHKVGPTEKFIEETKAESNGNEEN